MGLGEVRGSLVEEVTRRAATRACSSRRRSRARRRRAEPGDLRDSSRSARRRRVPAAASAFGAGTRSSSSRSARAATRKAERPRSTPTTGASGSRAWRIRGWNGTALVVTRSRQRPRSKATVTRRMRARGAPSPVHASRRRSRRVSSLTFTTPITGSVIDRAPPSPTRICGRAPLPCRLRNRNDCRALCLCLKLGKPTLGCLSFFASL